MTDEAHTYKLSEEQAQIALSPPDLPQLVLAPPGTGKTHTVIARITYLVAECGLDPASELLVPSSWCAHSTPLPHGS
jgi:superfamily I DNA/RNA helicase